MIVREIVRTCSNVHVANAALASIGGDFAAQFTAEAQRRNMSVGMLAAALVKEFSIKAADEEHERVAAAARGADQPILSGVRHILSQSSPFR